MLVREVQVEDIDQIIQIEEYCFDNPWSREAFEEEIENNETGVGLIAEDEGLVVGYITGLAVAGEFHLHNLAVHPDHQGQGVGRQLLTAVDAFCKGGDFHTIHLEVREDNEPACKLYKRMGYTAVGTRRDYYGPGCHAYLYSKKMGSS